MQDDIRKWIDELTEAQDLIVDDHYSCALLDLAPLVEAAREVVDCYSDEDTPIINALTAALRDLKVPGVE